MGFFHAGVLAMFEFFSRLTGKQKSIVVQNAVFRWENAVILAGAILLTWLLDKPFPWWPGWGWGFLGLMGLLAVFLSSLAGVRTNMQLLLNEFQGQFDLARIKTQELHRDVEMALEYQRRIEAKVRRPDAGILWDRPEDTANRLGFWIENIYGLALRLDVYQRDELLRQERESVPKEIDSLTSRVKREKNQLFRQDLDRALESKQRQWDAIQAYDARMKQAELQLTQTLAALATINSQVQYIDVQDGDSGRSDRILAEIDDQTSQLNDLVASINDVYGHRLDAG
jgi:hypothetical protein